MSRSTPVGFPLVATLLLPSENSPSLSADQVETRLRERIPGVVVDREQGDTYVAAKLKRLIELGTPEILLSGERSLTGRTLYVTVPVEGYPGVILSGYTFGFSDYDGCISLSCEPFDREALQAGTLGFAERMGIETVLGSKLAEVNSAEILYGEGHRTRHVSGNSLHSGSLTSRTGHSLLPMAPKIFLHGRWTVGNGVSPEITPGEVHSGVPLISLPEEKNRCP